MSGLRLWWFMHRDAIRRVAGAGVAVLAVCCALGGAYALVRSRLPKCGGWLRPACQVCPGLDAALAARAEGQYDRAAALADAALSAHPEQACWQDFKAQFNHNLRLKFKLLFLPGRRGAPEAAPAGPLRLSTKDPYYVIVNPSAKAYLYLFQVDGAGNLNAVFPNAGALLAKNPVPPGEQRIPGTNRFLSVSPRPGHERLYLVAATWEIPELEQIAKESASAKQGGRKELAKRFLDRAANEKHYAAPLPGPAFGQWDIESLGAPPSDGREKE